MLFFIVFVVFHSFDDYKSFKLLLLTLQGKTNIQCKVGFVYPTFYKITKPFVFRFSFYDLIGKVLIYFSVFIKRGFKTNLINTQNYQIIKCILSRVVDAIIKMTIIQNWKRERGG